MNKHDWLMSRDPSYAAQPLSNPQTLPDDPSAFLKQVTPRFWFANSFENSRTPCICMDDPRGGDPLIIAQLVPGEFWKNYLLTLIDSANTCLKMADEVMALNEKLSGPDRRMKMSEHTPGPWDGAGDFSIGRMIEGRYEWSAVAHVSERPDRDAPPGEGVANARLIAAAPDLLEALVKLVAIYDDEFGIVAPEMNAAIAAIAKATTTP